MPPPSCCIDGSAAPAGSDHFACTALTCSRVVGVDSRDASTPNPTPATTTAVTPQAAKSSASRYAAYGATSTITVSTTESSVRRAAGHRRRVRLPGRTRRRLPADDPGRDEQTLGEASLRLWTPTGSTVRFVRQVYPYLEDLTGRRGEVTARISEYPTGAWGAESRDYHLCIALPAGAVEEERLAARASLVSQDQTLVETRLCRRLDRRPHALGEARPARGALQRPGRTRRHHPARPGRPRCRRLPHRNRHARPGRPHRTGSGHQDTADLLGRLVDVVDARTGSVRLRHDATGIDAELANVRSVKTVRSNSR